MPKIIDISNQVFGRLSVIRFFGMDKQGAKWVCICTCGKDVIQFGKTLRSGKAVSCGCYKNEKIFERSFKHGHANKTAEYRAWRHMKSRCYNPNVYNYEIYGGSGIIVCDRWLESFEYFLSDMGARPTPEHSIDRINGKGNYEPKNCRWATKAEQSRNISTNRWIEFHGNRLILSDWATMFKTTPTNLSRMIKGKSILYAFNYYLNKIKND